ncbi:serine hydrolase [Terrimonas sp. NA20]|uniref:Serine hydrolase n=1 Tax=Terrimonas ginsenosidimutans TaxID=2908004 RepID=A0ABS9KW91_9BACT|nr:serine hydrolase domain-containing protein [Terrimonas ginsenosidimutans]MCG2616575.1 serine hydrolase [Terrimonas ginsenosidimutans]
MKNILYALGMLALLNSCNNTAPAAENTADTAYKAPAPGAVPEKEMRHYKAVLSSYFDSMLLGRGFSGGILVAKNGTILYESYAGFADIARKTPITDTSSIHIASTSKTFMGVAILGLVQDSLLSLEDSIQKFFPALPYPGVTVKMLLNHRSGMPNYLYFMSEGKWDKSKQVTNADVLNALYTEKPNRSFSPGRRFSYSNTNFVLLALIMEKITGIPYPQYMKVKYFDPLRMEHTFVCTLNELDRMIPSFNYNGTIWDNDFLEGTYGDKNIYSTPRDLLKWDQALYTEQLLKKAFLDSAFTPYSNDRPSVHNYGLGFRMLNLKNGKKVIYHFGRWHGCNAVFARLMDEKATIIILGNKYNRNIYHTANKSYDLFGNYLQGGGNEDDENAPVESKPAPGKNAARKAAPKKEPARKAAPSKKPITKKAGTVKKADPKKKTK